MRPGAAATLPPGLLVRASEERLAEVFPALVPLQPVARTAEGLVCSPRSHPEIAGPALGVAPLETEPLAEVPGWPRLAARMLGGFYVRTPDHVAPVGAWPSLVLAAGEAFGAHQHDTTRMALAGIPDLPDGAAMDVGCGAGLLALAWAALGKGPVTGIDIDAAAIAQARDSAERTETRSQVDFERTEIGRLDPALLASSVLLANLPSPGHHALLAHEVRPPALLLAGVARDEARSLLSAWRERGLHPRGASRSGRRELWVLRS